MMASRPVRTQLVLSEVHMFSCSLVLRGGEALPHGQQRASNSGSVECVFCSGMHFGFIVDESQRVNWGWLDTKQNFTHGIEVVTLPIIVTTLSRTSGYRLLVIEGSPRSQGTGLESGRGVASLLTVSNNFTIDVQSYAQEIYTSLIQRAVAVVGNGRVSLNNTQIELLFTVHGYFKGPYIPLVSCLLKNKRKQSYIDAMRILREECEKRQLHLQHLYIVIDFEQLIHECIVSTFPQTRIVGWTKIQKLGLAATYKDENSDGGKWLYYCSGLTYLRPEEVEDAFCDLISIQPADTKLTSSADYLTETYIDEMEQATFPPLIWRADSVGAIRVPSWEGGCWRNSGPVWGGTFKLLSQFGSGNYLLNLNNRFVEDITAFQVYGEATQFVDETSQNPVILIHFQYPELMVYNNFTLTSQDGENTANGQITIVVTNYTFQFELHTRLRNDGVLDSDFIQISIENTGKRHSFLPALQGNGLR
uniref:(California timema) hypothetical protein n=1 Tax=Timema californicum TaxID=61474 RepID=A0A7R9J1U2_TIMCA|nr:unnamed protein product [Timema californicum]